MKLAIEERCFIIAHKLVESGMAKLSEEMDIFDLTEVLIKAEKEKIEKENLSDSLIEYSEEIVEINETGEKPTIDITVTGDNLFYCNGILTKNSFGTAATADMMIALISTEELESLNQIMVKQIKNRYSDPTKNKRFVIGVDRAKMKLYDAESSAQAGIADSGQESVSKKETFQQLKNKFEGFRV